MGVREEKAGGRQDAGDNILLGPYMQTGYTKTLLNEQMLNIVSQIHPNLK